MSKVKGAKLMVFGTFGTGSDAKKYTLAMATSHSLSMTQNLESVGVKTKDDVDGGWDESEISTKAWSVSADCILSDDATTKGFNDIFDIWRAGKKVELVIAQPTASMSNGTWEVDNNGYVNLKGSAYVASIELSGEVNGYATYSISFTGDGVLDKVATSLQQE